MWFHSNLTVDASTTTSATVPPRIIIADDHEWIRQILVQVVHQTLPAAIVVETKDGVEAFRAYQNGPCDFLVSNHCMPNMDGMTLIRNVRKKEPDLPVLMVSSNSDAKEDALAAGANWFLPKEQIMEFMPQLLLGHTRGDRTQTM